MKYLKLFEKFLDTSWEDKNGDKITIKEVIKYLDEKGAPVEELETKLLKDIIIDVERDPNRVDNADLDFPIIVSRIDGKFSMVLDGQHRVAKCLKNGIKTIKARVLELDNAPKKYKKMFK
jgi:hypothetical protein